MAAIPKSAVRLLLSALVMMATAQVSMEEVEKESLGSSFLWIQSAIGMSRRLLQVPTPTVVPVPPIPTPAPPIAVPVTPIPVPAPAPAPTPTPALDCGAACEERCKLNYRHNLCVRACGTCCMRCKCVPPGHSGNREVCGTCYTDMKTHRNQTKCP